MRTYGNLRATVQRQARIQTIKDYLAGVFGAIYIVILFYAMFNLAVAIS